MEGSQTTDSVVQATDELCTTEVITHDATL